MLWLAFGVICLIVAAIYAVVWPQPKLGFERPPWRHLILRWGHTAVWLLLAASCFVRSTDSASAIGPANVLALLGGLLYASFIANTVIDRRG